MFKREFFNFIGRFMGEMGLNVCKEIGFGDVG
jgi:hypothetical protein